MSVNAMYVVKLSSEEYKLLTFMLCWAHENVKDGVKNNKAVYDSKESVERLLDKIEHCEVRNTK
jgi:hypothetical protein